MHDSERLIPVGRVGRPHGLDGAFVVDEPSDDPSRFEVGAVLLVDGEPATVVVSRRAGRGRPAVKLDRTVTRGAVIAVRAGDLPPPEPDAWYAFQLVGLRVEDTGARPLGTVVGVYPGVANDNLELDDGTLIPLVDAAVRSIELGEGRVVVEAGFLGT